LQRTRVDTADKVIAAILGTQESAAERGHQLQSSGVTWTDPVEADALRDALAAHKVENVMQVSAFMAAAALAQAVGSATNCARTALLFVEPTTATLAVVDSSDGSIAGDALARGAALASANASLGAPATVAIPQAQPAGSGAGELAYSAVPDDNDLYPEFGAGLGEHRGRGAVLVAISAMAIFVGGVVALALALALGIRPHAEDRSSLSKNVVAPASQAPAPKAQVPAPPPPSAVPPPATQAPSQAPAPVVQQPQPTLAPRSRNHRCIPGNGTAGTTAAGSVVASDREQARGFRTNHGRQNGVKSADTGNTKGVCKAT
jgi:hypothetical protein